ncbi:MAG: hypothetical protein KBD53_04340 [Candidatus Omnitrophica bacterium]|nr:hypothetical protein [Candidatus Omnitrophota bacterium]
MMKRTKLIYFLFMVTIFHLNILVFPIWSEEVTNQNSYVTIFDDKRLLNRGTEQYRKYSMEILIEMINDDALPNEYQRAAALRVFRENFSNEVVSKEKKDIEKILLRRLNNTDSPFVQVEIMHTLCLIDRYKYYKSMVPALIQKLDHYNATVNEMAFNGLENIVAVGNNRTREARIMFDTLKKVLFLSRYRLDKVSTPDNRLAQKLKLLRWSIKVLGNQELDELPTEVINLL